MTAQSLVFDRQLLSERAYWVERLQHLTEVPELPLDLRGERGASEWERLEIPMRAEAAARLAQVTRGSAFLGYVALVAAVSTYLLRLRRMSPVVIGSPAIRRDGEAAPENAVAVVIEAERGLSFRELLERARRSLGEAYQRQSYPFARLLGDIGRAPEEGHPPLFDVVVRAEGLHGECRGAGRRVDITLKAAGEGHALELAYDASRLRRDSVLALGRTVLELLHSGLREPGGAVGDLEWLDPDERGRVLALAQGRAVDHGRTATVDRLFAEQARRTPDAIALAYPGARLSYRELDERANRLAHHLRGRGLTPEMLVGVYLERSAELVVALLAILKAGGAYLPLDPAYPAARLAAMLEDGDAGMVVTSRALAAALPRAAARVVDLDAERSAIDAAPPSPVAPATTPDSLAYVMYTSGSTGRPKGIAIPHRGIVRLVRETDYVRIGPEDVIAQVANTSFDASTFEVWGALLHGARLAGIPTEIALAPAELPAALRAAGITTIFITTALFHQIAREAPSLFPALRDVLVGGEALDAGVIRGLLGEAPPARLLNAYGPTENTTFSTWHLIERVDPGALSVPIGRPIAGSQAYVLDDRMRPCPVGMIGELYVGGDGLARGYRRAPALTAERFVPDPFSARPGARLYRTGDLARLLPSGDIDFIGRADGQVKIRGFRIELGEIEAALVARLGAREAVVVVREDSPGIKRLVAYVALPPGEARTTRQCRDELRAVLPDYMLPSQVVCLERLPLNPNGKVDRRALPAPARERAEDEGEPRAAPATKAEEVLPRIWAEVLGTDWVGPNENFFELGGDSIRSIQIIARAHEEGIELTPKQMFEHQTIAELARVAAVSEGSGSAEEALAGPFPLAPPQRRFFEEERPAPNHYNSAILVQPRAALDPAALERAVGWLFEHHDALRLRFQRGASGWQQEVAPWDGRAPLEVRDLSGVPEEGRRSALAREMEEVQRSLDLERGPVARFVYFKLGAAEGGRLFFVPHHLVMDGVSWRIVFDDLERVYRALERGEAAPALRRTSSYRSFSEALARHAQGEAARRDARFWLDAAGAWEASIPVDIDRGPNSVESEETISVQIGAEATAALLRRSAEGPGAGVVEALVAALVEALEPWTGRRALVLDLETHGRGGVPGASLDVSRTVGWFAYSYPVRVSLDPERPALVSAREELRAVPGDGLGHAVLRYGGDPGLGAELARLPAAAVSLNYQGQFDETFSGEALFRPADEPCEGVRDARGPREHLIEVRAEVRGGALLAHWSYSANRHERATIDGLAQRFRERVAAHAAGDAARAYAPSDFPLAKLDQKQLDRLLARAKRGPGAP